MDVTDRQCAWIQRNRRPGDRAEPIGASASAIVDRQAKFLAPSQEIRRAIEEVVDEEFRHTCTFGGYQGGIVRLLVKEPRQVAIVRRVWWQPIVQQLRRRCPRRAIERLLFEPGSGGAAFGRHLSKGDDRRV